MNRPILCEVCKRPNDTGFLLILNKVVYMLAIEANSAVNNAII